MTFSKAWSLISISAGRQYGGNEGYADDPTRIYRYDNRVPNHKRLKSGDVVFLRDAARVIGVARIAKVTSNSSIKVERRCPTCKSTKIRERTKTTPTWKCGTCSAGFEVPTTFEVPVVSYAAEYESTFVAAPPGLSQAILKAAAPKPNDQHSIELLDPQKLHELLAGTFPAAQHLLDDAAASATLEPNDAAQNEPPTEFAPTVHDERQRILKEICQRRGQAAFRRALISRYGPKCMLSGCKLLDLIEAAHISPYLGAKDHHIDNGLLLRADIHTLFDLGLLAFNPDNLIAHVAPHAASAGYSLYGGVHLQVDGAKRPSKKALKSRWLEFCDRFMSGNEDPPYEPSRA